MSTMASQITSLTIVYSAVYSGTDQRKHQSSPSLAFVRGIHRWPGNSPLKWSVTRKMLPFDDVIMSLLNVSLPAMWVINACRKIVEQWNGFQELTWLCTRNSPESSNGTVMSFVHFVVTQVICMVIIYSQHNGDTISIFCNAFVIVWTISLDRGNFHKLFAFRELLG